MSTPQLSAADLSLLRQYDTPTICNVIELFDLQPRTAGYMDGRIRACFPEMAPIAGDVAQVAAEYVAAEAVILDFTKTGSNDVKKFTAARLECFHQLGELSK